MALLDQLCRSLIRSFYIPPIRFISPLCHHFLLLHMGQVHEKRTPFIVNSSCLSPYLSLLFVSSLLTGSLRQSPASYDPPVLSKAVTHICSKVRMARSPSSSVTLSINGRPFTPLHILQPDISTEDMDGHSYDLPIDRYGHDPLHLASLSLFLLLVLFLSPHSIPTSF